VEGIIKRVEGNIERLGGNTERLGGNIERLGGNIGKMGAIINCLIIKTDLPLTIKLNILSSFLRNVDQNPLCLKFLLFSLFIHRLSFVKLGLQTNLKLITN